MPKSSRRQRQLDMASTATLVITVVLFAIAAAEKGLTHDLLLEAGVFLVSAKLVIASYQNKMANQAIDHKLDQLVYEFRMSRMSERPSLDNDDWQSDLST